MPRLARLILIGGLLVWIVNAALWLGADVPLGHDESQYATETRAWFDGEPKHYLYVSVGMNAVGAPGLALGGSERALRVLPALIGVLFLFAAWRIARRAAGDESACWLVGVLAGAHPIVQFNAQLLTDLPSTFCLLAALTLLLDELTRTDGPRYRIIAAAPLCAASFYVRYGSSVTIAIIGVVSLAVGWRAIARRPIPVVATVVVFLVLLLPHLSMSLDQTGSLLGIISFSSEAPGGAGEGLLEYVAGGNPLARYGHLIAPLMLIGAIPLRRDRLAIALVVVALAQIVALGLTTHAQTRYVFLAVVLLVTLGIDTVRRAAAHASERVRVALAACATALVVLTWMTTFTRGADARDKRRTTAAPAVLAAAAIRADVGNAKCAANGPATAQLEWYSRCKIWLWIGDSPAADHKTYAVRTDDAPLPGTTIFYAPGVVRVVRLAEAQ